MRPEMFGGSYLRLDFPCILCLYPLTITMCWDEYNNHKAALAAERVLRNYGHRVSRDPNRIAWVVIASEQARRQRLVAHPPLPPDFDPHDTSTRDASTAYPDHYTLLQRLDLLLPYYCVFFTTIFLSLPILIFLGVIEYCLEKVGLWPYIESLLLRLGFSPLLFAARINLRCGRFLCGTAIGLGRKCTRLVLAVLRYTVSSVSHRVPRTVFVVLSLGSYTVFSEGR
jgi:hypothetical protein